MGTRTALGRPWSSLLLVGSVVAATAGCVALRHRAIYGVVVHNGTTHALSDVGSTFDGFSRIYRILPAGGTAGFDGVRAPLPEYSWVQFRTPDGTFHKKRVTVRSQVGPSIPLHMGDLWFRILPGGQVVVWFEPWKEP